MNKKLISSEQKKLLNAINSLQVKDLLPFQNSNDIKEQDLIEYLEKLEFKKFLFDGKNSFYYHSSGLLLSYDLYQGNLSRGIIYFVYQRENFIPKKTDIKFSHSGGVILTRYGDILNCGDYTFGQNIGFCHGVLSKMVNKGILLQRWPEEIFETMLYGASIKSLIHTSDIQKKPLVEEVKKIINYDNFIRLKESNQDSKNNNVRAWLMNLGDEIYRHEKIIQDKAKENNKNKKLKN